MAQRKLEDFFRGKRKSREEHGEEERDDGAKPSDISTAAEPNASVESTSRANVSDSGLSGDVQPSSSAPSSAHSNTLNYNNKALTLLFYVVYKFYYFFTETWENEFDI